MKYREFTEAEQDTANARLISAALKRAGYQQLGSGADATVWAKDAGQVIKIIMPDDGGTAAAQVFRKFFEFCIKHQGAENLPRFVPVDGHVIYEFELGGRTYIQVGMEELKPVAKGSVDEAVIWLLSDIAARKKNWPQAKKDLLKPQNWQHYHDDHTDNNKLMQMLADTNLDKYENLYKIITLLYHTGRINRFGWDLHTENVMQRKDGTLVVIDPWFADEASL